MLFDIDVFTSSFTAMQTAKMDDIPVTQMAVIVGIEVLLSAFINICIRVPTCFALLLRRFQFPHKNVSSDIPGNPHAFDNSIISSFRTLPEPCNTNIVWTNISYDKNGCDLLITGSLPFARCNSLSVYEVDSDDPPSSVNLKDIADVETGFFEIILKNDKGKDDEMDTEGTAEVESKEDAEKVSNCLHFNSNWKKGFISMRNYLVPAGTRIVTPEVKNLKTGKIVRSSQVLVVGPTALALSTPHSIKARTRVAFLQTLLFFANLFLLKMHVCVCITVAIASVVLSYLCYQVFFLVGRYRLHTLWADTALKGNKEEHPKVNELILSTLGQGAKVSQPCSLHTYWFMKYDLKSADSTLSIRGKIDPKKQAYWSVVSYDLYGIPLPQLVNDLNVHRIYKQKESALAECVPFSPSENDEYEYNIRLCRNPEVRVGSTKTKDADFAVTELDVSKSLVGYVLFRLVHPENQEAIEFSAPMTVVYNREMHQEQVHLAKKTN